MRNRAQELAELLHLPAYSFVLFGMVVGYPDPDRDTKIRPRPAQNVVLHHESYQAERPDGWLEACETAYRDFRFTSHMRKLAWAESIKNCVSYAYMDGRQNLRGTVQNRGFGLG